MSTEADKPLVPADGNMPFASIPADLGRMIDASSSRIRAEIQQIVASFRESQPSHEHPRQIGRIKLDGSFHGISIGGLAELYRAPNSTEPPHEAMEMIEVECHGQSGGMGRPRIPCETAERFMVARFFASMTCCATCRAKADKAEKLDRAKLYWESLCPPDFRDTSKTHPDWPAAQYAATRPFSGGESLFLFGPSGKGKTRLAVWLLRRCLVKYNQHVGILWPEQLKAVKNTREILQWVQLWGRYDLLLIDDGLLTAASDGRVTDAFKDLLDYRMRYKRHNIITSQIGGDDVAEQLKKFGKDTKADRELVEALVRRLREVCRVISFADVTPQAGEASF